MFKHLRYAVLAGLFVFAACGADVEGTWQGTWTADNGNSGVLTLLMQQSGSEVKGNFAAPGLCVETATIEGTIDGDAFSATATRDDQKVELKGTVKDDKEISGTFTVPPGSPCAGITGDWKVSKL